MCEVNLYDLSVERFGRFDIVLFAGVLYHLRYPFWGLRVIRKMLVDGGKLILETAVWRGQEDRAMLFCTVGDESPYEPTSCTFFNEKGLRDTLYSMGFAVQSSLCLTKHKSSRMTAMMPKAEDSSREYSTLVNGHTAGDLDRLVLLCEKLADRSGPLSGDYWEATHAFHSEREDSGN